MNISTRARAGYLVVHGQFYATRRESEVVEMPSVRNGMQGSETMRNSLGLNYKSAGIRHS
jgi:hypothetical protein